MNTETRKKIMAALGSAVAMMAGYHPSWRLRDQLTEALALLSAEPDDEADWRTVADALALLAKNWPYPSERKRAAAAAIAERHINKEGGSNA